RQVRHPAAAALEGQHAAALQVILGHLQLACADRPFLQLAELLQDELDDLPARLGGRRRVYQQVAAVEEGVDRGEDRVGEAALLADVLEQARRHGAAEERVQDVLPVAC